MLRIKSCLIKGKASFHPYETLKESVEPQFQTVKHLKKGSNLMINENNLNIIEDYSKS
uniref:Uncharacterized protein n=1 Tax=Rhizophagus irregularis (strain DAOM 181602 / DAOM 197198 / MUCL 43194) TaxID=747089 RepID=U9TSF8_RHIID